MKKEKRCSICNRKLGPYATNNQLYCDKSIRNCYKVAKLASQRVIRQRIILEQKPKKCKRCLKFKLEKNMRAYCEDCKEEMKGYVSVVNSQKNSYIESCCEEIADKLKSNLEKDDIMKLEKPIDAKWTNPRGSKRRKNGKM